MIQAWLTKNALQLGVVGVIISAIFFAGWGCGAKSKQKKVDRIKNRYEQCLEQNEIAVDGLNKVKDALEKQSQALSDLTAESQKRLLEQKRYYTLALDLERQKRLEIIKKQQSEIIALREKFEVLTEAEACHEAWKELAQ